MPATLKLEIVTPEAQTYSDDVEMVTLPGSEGEMGVYPQHVPLMTQLAPGEVIVRKDGQDTFLAVGEGFVEIKADNIDEAKAEEARRRAEARLAEHLNDEDSAVVSAALANALAQINVKRRRHH
jgi:F-type H+-transporting ATPase subunit epsilon